MDENSNRSSQLEVASGDNSIANQSQPNTRSSPGSNESFSGRSNVFVSSLPLDYDEEALKVLFMSFGKVISAKVMVDFVTGTSKGYGFVKFQKDSEALQAIERMNDQELKGKKLVVKFAESEGTPLGTPNTNLFVKGLPLSMTEDQLYSLFSSYGTIINHKIMEGNGGISRGQGFVRFSDLKSAEYAINALNGFVFPGTTKEIVVRYADTEEEKQLKKQKKFRNQHFPMPKMMQRYNPYSSNFGLNTSSLFSNQMAQVSNYYAQFPSYAQQAIPAVGMDLGSLPSPPPSSILPSPFIQYVNNENNAALDTAAFAGDQDFTNLFIYHLPANTDESLLKNLFSPFGPIVSVKVMKDLNTGQCKGYGFVRMANWMSAQNAIVALNGYKIENKYLSVSYKRPQPQQKYSIPS